MHIINKEEIDRMIETIHPKLDESNLFHIDDEDLSSVLRYYLFLQQFPQDIITHFPVTHEEILYSQYYWFVHFKNQYFLKVGYDGGIDQQAHRLLENLCNGLDGEVDWEFIEEIEKSF